MLLQACELIELRNECTFLYFNISFSLSYKLLEISLRLGLR
jgi:hypothetical protein